MPNFISSELTNRFFKLGLRDKATAGALVHDRIGPMNASLVNYIGRQTLIEKTDQGLQLADPKLRQTIENLIRTPEGSLKFNNLRELIDETQFPTMDGGNTSLAFFAHALALESPVIQGFRQVMSIIRADERLLKKPFSEVVNCIEYAVFIEAISKLYFPNTEVRIIFFSEKVLTGVKAIFNGIRPILFNRHAYFVFKDTDGQKYAYVYGQKVRSIDDTIMTLTHKYGRAPEKYAYIPKLIKKIQAESNKL